MREKKNTTIEGVDPNGTIQQSEAGSKTENASQESVSKKGSTEDASQESARQESASEKAASEKTARQEVNETEDERKLRIKRENDAAAKRAKRAAEKADKGIVNAHIDAVPNTPSAKAKKAEKAPKASNVTADFLAKQIYGTHELMSMFLGEEVRISQPDAVMLGEAAFEVIKEYDLAWIGKWGKWGGLITAVAIVEVPVVMRLRNKQAAAQVMPMTQVVDQLVQPSGVPGVAVGSPS